MSPAQVPDTGPREGRSGEWGPGNLGSHCGGLSSSARGAVTWWCKVLVRERGDNHRTLLLPLKCGSILWANLLLPLVTSGAGAPEVASFDIDGTGDKVVIGVLWVRMPLLPCWGG